MATVHCPTCGAAGEAGSFCEMGCGRLPAAHPQPAASPAAEAMSASTACAPRLRVCLPRRFTQGRSEALVFAYGLSDDAYESVSVRLKNGADVKAEVRSLQRPGRGGELAANVVPGVAGRFVLDVEFACRRDGAEEDEVYLARIETEVVPALTGLNYSPVYNISGNYGNEIHINGAAPQMPGGPEPQIELDLQPRLVRTPSKLLLVNGGRVVQLLARSVVTFGRSRANDVVLRVFGPDGCALEDCSRRISGTHFRLEFTPEGCVLVDGGDRPSTNGTYVDGSRLPPLGRTVLRGSRHEVGFGAGSGDLVVVLTLHRDVFGALAGCTVERKDAAQRRTLVLAKEAPLGGDVRIAWDGCCFHARGNGASRPLAPGLEVTCGDGVWRAAPYRPTWIH